MRRRKRDIRELMGLLCDFLYIYVFFLYFENHVNFRFGAIHSLIMIKTIKTQIAAREDTRKRCFINWLFYRLIID